MKYYYLLNGKIMATNEKTPESNLDKFSKLIHPKVSVEYADWYSSLQPCEISESELCLILSNVSKLDYDSYVEVTDMIRIEEIKTITKSGTITDFQVFFKHPKQVDGEIEAVDALLNTFGQYCTLNGIKLTDSNKVGQAVIDFLKSDIYKIFKNQK